MDTRPYEQEKTEYKVNLFRQIERIGENMSTRIEATHGPFVMLSYRMLVEAQINSVDALEAMLAPYHDDNYAGELKLLKEEMKKDLGSIDDNTALNAKQIFAEKKFALLVKLMDRWNLLLTRTIKGSAGFGGRQLPERIKEGAVLGLQ